MNKIFKAFLLVAAFAFGTANAQNTLSIADFDMVPGSQITIPVNLTNPDAVQGIQFAIALPSADVTIDDVTLTDRAANGMDVVMKANADKTKYTVIVYSSNAECFSGNEGAILNVKLSAKEAVAFPYIFDVTGISLSKSAVKESQADFSVKIGNKTITAINGNKVAKDNNSVYDINGVKVNTMSKAGVYVVNGKKVYNK